MEGRLGVVRLAVKASAVQLHSRFSQKLFIASREGNLCVAELSHFAILPHLSTIASLAEKMTAKPNSVQLYPFAS